jgi:hypothetical protein
MRNYSYIALSLILAFSCKQKEEKTPTLFQELDPAVSGVNFSNDLSFDEDFNIFTYRNYYNGGGVALGDVNQDGLLDIYLTANLGPNRLYLNRGNLKFEDVTEQAGVAGTRAWSTGVAMADVNGDGLLDIYVCNSGDISGDNKQNELFINQGNGNFSEEAEKYGLADEGFSTHAVFFDYDKDGDLDVYLLNNSYQAIGSFNKMQNERPKRDPVGGDKLFRNDGDTFTDVSEDAGIYGSIIGFGLGITIGDVNQDTWPDIFISNDFFEKDYLYINNQDGTFTESLESSMRSISAASMGADIADINGDGLLDIFVTDMLPEPLERLKQVTTFENWDKFQFNKIHGYHYQFSRNMLHLNNGDGSFSEVGRLANVEATDWSWGALIFDMDSDGKRDLFVANGIYQDITDLDYLNFIDDEDTKVKIITGEGVDYRALIDPIPITPVPNYAYQNQGNLKFVNQADAWGLGKAIHSNGAAYGDLNNDGYPDLVINNVNRSAQLFINQADSLLSEKNYLQIQLEGKSKNTYAIGTQIQIKAGEEIFYQEQMPNRGFQSSVDPKITIGLGRITKLDEIRVTWPDNRETILKDQDVNQLISLKWEDAVEAIDRPSSNSDFGTFKKENKDQLAFEHRENIFVDFDRDRLTYHLFSTEGPAMATADVNGDGLEDFYFGGSKDAAGQLFLASSNGNFQFSSQTAFEGDKNSEDTDAVFFDANRDGSLDLFVSSGGNEFPLNALDLADRLYLNDGKGNFTKSENSGLQSLRGSSSVVVPIDINEDGAMDLFVGDRLVPFVYGAPASSHIWINDGNGQFTEQTQNYAPELLEIGMVTDAAKLDWDGDGKEDLVLVGDWMAPTFFRNTDGKLEKISMPEMEGKKGWYRSLKVADLNKDQKPDLILGNQGLNTRFKASEEQPVRLYLNDFDQNGSIEQLFTTVRNGVAIPYTLKHELEKQVPSIKKKYIRYSNYNNQTLEQIFDQETIGKSIISEINHLESGVLMNQGSGKFEWKSLPIEAQRSMIFAIETADLNGDGILDLILGGNLYGIKPEIGKSDASYGEVLLGNGDGTFRFIPNRIHSMQLQGEVRHFKWLSDSRLLVIKNNAAAEIWRYEE